MELIKWLYISHYQRRRRRVILSHDNKKTGSVSDPVWFAVLFCFFEILVVAVPLIEACFNKELKIILSDYIG